MEDKEFDFRDFRGPDKIIRDKIYLSGELYKLFMRKNPYYYIGKRGDILMCDIVNSRFIRCNVNRDGVTVRLYDGSGDGGNGRKAYRLEEIVAKAWVNNPKGYTYIKHNDGNIYNNHSGNLRWVRIRPLIQRKKKPKVLLRAGDEVKCYKSLYEASIDTGMPIYQVIDYANTGEVWGGGNRMEWVF